MGYQSFVAEEVRRSRAAGVSGPSGGPIVTQPVQTDYHALRAMLAEHSKPSA